MNFSCNIMQEEVKRVSAALDFFDSEMFEWTQRPCSPELCSISLELQVSSFIFNTAVLTK